MSFNRVTAYEWDFVNLYITNRVPGRMRVEQLLKKLANVIAVKNLSGPRDQSYKFSA